MPVGNPEGIITGSTMLGAHADHCIIDKPALVVRGLGLRDVHLRIEKGQLMWCGLYDPSLGRWEWPSSPGEIEQVMAAVGSLPEI